MRIISLEKRSEQTQHSSTVRLLTWCFERFRMGYGRVEHLHCDPVKLAEASLGITKVMTSCHRSHISLESVTCASENWKLHTAW